MSITKLPETVEDNWVLLATNTPTSGSSISFTSIAADFKKLRVKTETKVQLTSNGYLYLELPGVTGYDYQWFGQTGSTFKISVHPGIYFYTGTTSSYQNVNLYLINPSNSISFVEFYGSGASLSAGSQYEYGWIHNQTTAITQIDLETTNTFNAANTGEIQLWGTY